MIATLIVRSMNGVDESSYDFAVAKFNEFVFQ
jgi:hypothetical protein